MILSLRHSGPGNIVKKKEQLSDNHNDVTLRHAEISRSRHRASHEREDKIREEEDREIENMHAATNGLERVSSSAVRGVRGDDDNHGLKHMTETSSERRKRLATESVPELHKRHPELDIMQAAAYIGIVLARAEESDTNVGTVNYFLFAVERELELDGERRLEVLPPLPQERKRARFESFAERRSRESAEAIRDVVDRLRANDGDVRGALFPSKYDGETK